MSESEKAWAKIEAQVREWDFGGEAPARAAFDTIIAEHRAEVEALRGEVQRGNERWAADGARIEEVERRASAARDAALEEGAHAAAKAGASHPQVAAILAQKSQRARATFATKRAELLAAGDPDPTTGAEPARQYVDVEKVRESLLAFGDMEDPNTVVLLTKIARRLGVDLDAKGERCPECGHAPHWVHGTKDTAPHSYCPERFSWGAPNCGCDYMPAPHEVLP